MKNDVSVKSDEFWVKIVEFLQQNWALIDEGEKVKVCFIHDGSGVFDEMEFSTIQEAEKALGRNGFKKYLDPDEKFTDFISPPKRPFFDAPRRIYSSGQFWR